MKISFNPSNSNKNILDLIKNNKDIIFDLKGHSIFARGVEFKGTDTNTWRPVVDNLTSDSTTSSLSAKQGKVLKALIDGKSNSDHNHDGRYVRYYAVTTLDCNNLAAGLTSARISATNAAHTNHSAYLYISDVGTPFQIQIPDSSIPYIYKRYYGSGKWSGWFKLNAGYADSAGSVAWANVTGKPSSYTPSAHTHAWNSLTHSSTTENQAILTNGKANGWKLQTLNIARWDNAANNAHSHANKSVLDGITSALVNSWNTAYNFVSNITGTDTDKVINKWEEIVNFLAGITEDNKLNTLLNSKLSVYELADNTNVGTIKNNGIYYSTTDASSRTLINSPFNTGFAFINMTSYDRGDDLRRSRLAFNAFGEIKVSDDRDQANTAETWYNVLTSKNSGINGSTIKLNGTSITVYSSGTADGRYVKKSGDTMSGVLTIDTPNFGALTIKRNHDADGASIQFRGKSSVYGYIGLNNSTKDKQFLRWSSDTSRIYTILDTSSTYISNGKGVINGTTITQVDNADTLDGVHLSYIRNWSDRTASAYWKAGWYKVASAQTATNVEAFVTLDVNAANSEGHATLFIRKRADSKPYFICIHNNKLNLADFRLYYNGMSMVLYARVPNDWNGRVFRIISEGREGIYDHIWTLYSNRSNTDPNAISAEGGNPYINPTYSGRVNLSNSSDKANYANSAGSVAWNNVTGKPSAFNPAAHTHTVFKNNLMIKGTNGISDSASIHLGIGDSDTGFKWISDGVCQIYANNVAVGQWTSGGMDWFKNPTVNGNKVWNAGNDGSGSGLDADTLDGYHANGSNDRPYGHIPTIESDGVMEVGRYIDFHKDNNGKYDFSTRLRSTDNYGNEVNLPSASGTLALINDVNNYYWANVKISTSSSTTTSPTFSNVYLGNSLYLNTRGSNSIYNGPNDSANGVGGPLNNLVFSSWHGVSFTTSCAGFTYTNKNAVSINCRTGQLCAREVQANGFMHTGHNNNDAVLLAGGGYKTLKDFIFMKKSYNYLDTYYNICFHKASNNIVWVDGHVKGSVTKSFAIDPAFFPYPYDNDPNLNTIYHMSGNDYITINTIGVVTVNNTADHRWRVGFFYMGRD